MDDEFGEKPQAATKSHGGEVAADAEGRSGVDAAQARVEAFTSAVSEGVTHLEVMEKTMEKWGGSIFYTWVIMEKPGKSHLVVHDFNTILTWQT